MRVVRILGLLVLLIALGLGAVSRPGPGSAFQDGSPVASPTAGPDPCGSAMDMTSGTPVAEADIDPTTLDLDLLYIDVMIPHHEMAIEMARVAQVRSTRTEVVSLAAAMIESQSREVDQLRAWRDAWYPDVPALSEPQIFAGLETKASSPGRGGAPGLSELSLAGMASAMTELCDETEQFDLTFINAMVEHHTGAVLISQLVVEQAIHPELKELAREIVDTQGAEIEQMLSWRDAWYGGVPLGDDHGAEGTPTG